MLFKVKHPLHEIDLGFDSGYTYYSREKYISDTIRSMESERKAKQEKEVVSLQQRTAEERSNLKKDYIYNQKVKYGDESIQYINNLSEACVKSLNEIKKKVKIKNDSLEAFVMISKNYYFGIKINMTPVMASDFEYNPEKIIELIKVKKTNLMKMKYHHFRNSSLNSKEIILYADMLKLIDFTDNHLNEIEKVLISVIDKTFSKDLEEKINNMSLAECVQFRKDNKI